ncbi:MAG: hypothetical protein M0Z58_05480 [Nitrospiraceae bacterium]|nr:hypothetical protein [Nitrospiraceae bacterium]
MTEGSRPEARAQKREPATFPISCSYSFEEQGRSKSIIKHGISLDLSESGICIYAPVRLDEGMRLSVSGEPWREAREGSVRWCKMITPELFRVGIQLLAGPHPIAPPSQA